MIKRETPATLKKQNSGWAAIPQETVAKMTNPDAAAIWLDLALKPDNWVIRRDYIAKRWNFGSHRLRNALKELRDMRVLWDEYTRDPGTGAVTGKQMILSYLPRNSHLDDDDQQVSTNDALNDDGRQVSHLNADEQQVSSSTMLMTDTLSNDLENNKDLSTTVFGMHLDWTPDEIEGMRPATMGIKHHPPEWWFEVLGEFRSYWLGQPNRKHTQDQWTHKLLQKAKREQENQEAQHAKNQLGRNQSTNDEYRDRAAMQPKPMFGGS